MRAILFKSLVAALLMGPAIGFLNEATSVQKATIYKPPLSEAEMARMRNLPMSEVDASLRTRRVQLTRWEWLEGSIHYEYFWKRVAARTIVPTFGVFIACIWISWTERRKTQTLCRMVAAVSCLLLSFATAAHAQEPEQKQIDSYDVLLHSRNLADQRSALITVMHDPEKYVQRVQQSLREYSRLLRINPVAANRAVYISALLRDPTFPPILVKQLGNTSVLEECTYPCPVVFALTINAGFTGWKVPTNLDSQLTTVYDLRSSIRNLSHLTLKVGSIDDVVQGPMLEKHRGELEEKSEEQLIHMAGPTGRSYELRLLAACRLETLIADSKNRVELYLLALNEIRDASGDYRDALYQAIYRAELAKVR